METPSSTDSPSAKRHRPEKGGDGAPAPPLVSTSHVTLSHLNVKIMFCSGKLIGSDASMSQLFVKLGAMSSAPYMGDSCVCLVTRVLNSQAALDKLDEIVCAGGKTSENRKNPEISAFIDAAKRASGNLIDESFFIFDEEREVVGSINAVPIIVFVCGDEREEGSESSCSMILSQLNSMNPLGPYLLKLSESERRSSDKGAEGNTESDPFPTLDISNLPCAVMFTNTDPTSSRECAKDRQLTRVVQKIKVANSGVLHSMSLLRPAHDEAHLLLEIYRSTEIRKQIASEAQEGEKSLAIYKNIMRQYANAKTTSSFRSDDGYDLGTIARNLGKNCDEVTTPLYTILYAGASWCPPCMRIIRELPSMLTGMELEDVGVDGEALSCRTLQAHENKPVEADIPLATVCSMIKVDYDTSPSILQLFGIETIPSFIVLDVKKLTSSIAESNACARTDAHESSEVESTRRSLLNALVTEPLQNSQRPTVSAYFAKACSASLSFTLDDDF